jgi:DNA-binding response OmpR family regulator
MQGGNILLLDDDSFLTKIYSAKFSEAGCHVQSAGSVDDALRILRGGFVPDAVIFDLELKDKDGFQFLEALREQKLAQRAYLLALTNHSEESHSTRAAALGASSYVVKATMIPDEVVSLVVGEISKLRA